MTKIELYEAALAEMLEKGDVQAGLVLAIGKLMKAEAPEPSLATTISVYISMADHELRDALRANESKWTHATDRAIERARLALNSLKTQLVLK